MLTTKALLLLTPEVPKIAHVVGVWGLLWIESQVVAISPSLFIQNKDIGCSVTMHTVNTHTLASGSNKQRILQQP